MEESTGIEPISRGLQPRIFAFGPTPHMGRSEGIEPSTREPQSRMFPLHHILHRLDTIKNIWHCETAAIRLIAVSVFGAP